MGQIIQYRPAYFSGFENQTKAFTNLAELLNIEFVDNFRKLPNGQINPQFHQYSISPHSSHKGYEYTLMAEYKDGKEWWVIGYLDESSIIHELPTWKPNKNP